ncbi:ketoacyl-ACP synthase III [Nocardia terpenica]|uniref:ketoacyl-ACP synthase III n=1 Tax=Nocardia terpenica TaxID=455432 RepID=UPI000305444D|nr:ketoacyl-ACP synthase III [Nocardia terpenica]NQE90859.1 ketoacyl-ACP synthase III [Nocardia terpenica]
MGIGIIGIGEYSPRVPIGNDQISRWASVDQNWIVERTGINNRYYAKTDQATSDLAAAAVRDAVAASTVSSSEIGFLVVATSAPDQPLPATAVHVQRKAGLSQCPAFDINAVCCGFIYGLVLAANHLAIDPRCHAAICVGADVYSRIMDRRDRRTVSLFGDGAGAVVLSAVPDSFGIIGYALSADGATADYVEVPAGGSALPCSAATLCNGDDRFRMQGGKVLEYASATLPKAVNEAADIAGVRLGDIDRVIIHQGNVRMVERIGSQLGIDRDRIAFSGDRIGNTAAASVPMTLFRSHGTTPLHRGDLVLLAAIGGGMTTGAVVMRWY